MAVKLEDIEKRRDVSLLQLEALTALATSASAGREVERLFEELADSITRFTDYRTCTVLLFTDEPPFHPRLLSYSANVPAEYAERLAAGSYPREEVNKLIADGVHIEVGQLGFAAYFPPRYYPLLDRVFPERYKTDLPTEVPEEGAHWHEGDELFVPLATRDGEAIGIISLDDPRSGRAPDRESVLPVVAFARQVAQLLARQMDADALAEQVEREALVNRITRAVRRTLDPAEVFRTAVEEMGLHLDVDRCVLFMLDHEAGVARNVAEYDAPGIDSAGCTYSIPLIQSVLESIRARGVLSFDDAANDERLRSVYEKILNKLGTRSLMYAAITVGDDMRGTFAISSVREQRRWRESDIALARAVADQTGIAIRQAELFEMVARAKQTWEATFDAMSDGIFIYDNERRLMRVNRAGAAMESLSPRQILGRRCCDILRASDSTGCIVERALKEARGVTVEYALENSGRTLFVKAEPVREDARQVGTVCIARDITEQKQERERAAQADKLRALGQLASGVAHDFNNALAAILGRAQLLRRQTHDEEMAHSLDVIQTAAEDAAATVQRIRAFARQSPCESTSGVNVCELLHDAAEITRTRWENDARARGLHYDVNVEAEGAFHIEGNASELREVFVNLIVNAVDAMPRGGKLLVRCRREGDEIQLLFADTGTGMSEAVRERIFEPFYTTKGVQGTGLGLFVSYGIVERHRGSIAVESEPGRGATFAITLPYVERAEQSTTTQTVTSSGPSLSVLVIDDEPFVRETLVDMIAALEHRVVAADGAASALRALEAGRFDLVFTDLSMPGMDGWEVAREIRRRWPEVRICIVTGYGREVQHPPGSDNPADALIGKPFNFEQVEETLAKFKS